MQNNNPKVSVIMSSYNGQKYLKQAIESILNQTFSDFEFLIVNDSSTDTTPQILQEYANKDNRIKIINNENNLGLTKSLNKALSIAKGKYMARMDDDDISAPNRLEKQLSFVQHNPDVALCGTLAVVVNDKREKIAEKVLPTIHNDIKKKLLFNNQFIHTSLFFKRELGLYNESFQRAQDYEFVLRIASKYQVANLNEYLVKWTAREGSLSFSGTKQQRCAIKARWWAITKYGYPKFKGLLHILLRTGYLLWPKK